MPLAPSPAAQSNEQAKREQSGAILWLLCCQFFLVEQIARLSVRGPYSMMHSAISDLGALRTFGFAAAEATSSSPLHILMNASFVLQGLLISLGALGVRSRFDRGWLSRAAFLLLHLAALGVLVVGLAPEDRAGDLHVLAASLHFLCGSLAMLLLGLALLRRAQATELAGTLSIGAGAIALCATLLLGLDQTSAWSSLGWPAGLIERVAAYPLPLWLVITAIVLLGRDRGRNVFPTPSAES